MEIDIEALRNDLIEYLGTAKEYNPAAVIDLIEVERGSYQTVVNAAIRFGFDLEEYDVNKGRTF